MRFARISWKILLALGASATLLTLAVFNIQQKSAFRLLDDGVLWESRYGRVLAKRIDPQGPAARAGVEPGDVLVAIGDRPVAAAEDPRRILDESAPGDVLTYHIVREEARQARSVAVAPLARGNVGLYYFLAAVGVFSLVVGTAVYVRRRGVAATAHFYLLCLFWFLAFAFSHTGKLDGWDFAFYWMDRVGLLFFPPIFLHFALCFPHRKPLVERNGWLLPLVYVPSFLLLYGALGAKLLFFSEMPWSDTIFIGANRFLDRFLPVFVAAGSLAAFFGFVDSYRRARTITVKKQTKWIVWGTGFGTLPFGLFYAVPYAAGLEPSLGMELSAVTLALVPLSFAYAIVKYRLMDVEVLFKRGVVYTLATVAVVGVYLAIFLAGTHYLVGDPHSLIIAILATMVVVLLFTPIKSKIQIGIDRLFYRERYDYRRALLAFSRDLNADLDLDRLARRLVERIRDTFEVEKVALLVAQEIGDSFATLAGVGLAEAEWREVTVRSDSALMKRLLRGEVVYYGEHDWRARGSTSPAGLDGPGGELAKEEPGLPVEGLQYAIPCLAQSKVVGVILLGRRWDQSALSSEDMELLQTLSGQAATALENARLYHTLRLKVEEFERLKEQSENTIESLEAGILVLDLDGRVMRWNRALERLYGVLRDEALGRSLAELFPASFQEILRTSMGERWWTRAEITGISRLNLTARRGERKVVKLQVAPFVSEGGKTEGNILIFEDVTERVELENQLQLREKMASLGLLAAGVAHEVNTPLTGISSFTQMLRGQTPEDDPRSKLLEKIERQTERASKIVNNLLNFARRGRSDFVPVDVNEIVGDVLSLLEHQLSRGKVKVRRDLDSHLPQVLGDENKLQQVFLNLILNAQEAMPSGGWLTISTSFRGGEVTVEVADTGQGIGKEDIKRIYDPFFTTKSAGRSGTGLGLSITYGIVQEHSGHISVQSAVGKGTRFHISLPALETRMSPAELPAGGGGLPRTRRARGS